MSVRESIDQHRTAASVGGIILVAAACLVIWMQFRQDGGDSAEVSSSSRAFFTVDDGKTFFADSSKRVPPFEYKGAIAVRAHVFTSDGGKTSFVGYLERFTPDAKAKMERMLADGGDTSVTPPSLLNGLEVKKPQAPEWVKAVDRTRAGEICSVANGVEITPAEKP